MILLRLFICFIAVNFIVGASGSQFGVLESSDNQIDWANLTASSLGTIDPTQFSTITLSQLQSIPAQACSGFIPTQISSIQDEICSNGFQPAQISQIPAVAFAGFRLGCFFNLFQQYVSSMAPEQIAHVAPEVFNGLGVFTTRIPAPVFALLSPERVSAFSDAVCANLESVQLASITPEAFRVMTSVCISQIPSHSWSGMTPGQASVYNIDWMSTLTEITLTYINPAAFGALPASVFARLSPSDCSSISGSQMASIPPENFPSFTISCLEACQNCWYEINSTQVSMINPYSFMGASKYWNTFPNESYAGISAEQLGTVLSIGNYVTNCALITPGGIRNFQHARLQELTPDCFNRLQPDTLAALSGDLLRLVNDNVIFVMGPIQIHFLPPDAFSLLNRRQISLLVGDTDRRRICASFSPQQVANLPDEFFGYSIRVCWAQIPAESVTLITPDQMARLPGDACVGITGAQLTKFPAAAFSGMTPSCFQNIYPPQLALLRYDALFSIPPGTFAAISAEQFGNLSKDSLHLLPDSLLAALPPDSFIEVTRSSLTLINPRAFSGLTLAQFNVLLDSNFTVLPRLTASQWAAMPIELFRNIRCTDAFTSINGLAFTSLSQEQLEALPPAIFQARKCNGDMFWRVLTLAREKVLSFVTPAQLGNADETFCSVLISPTAAAIPTESWKNITLECASFLHDSVVDVFLTLDILNSYDNDLYNYFMEFGCLPTRVLLAMPNSQLSELAGPALGCISPDSWVALINAHADNVTDFIYRTWTPDQFAGSYRQNKWESLKFNIRYPNSQSQFLAMPSTVFRPNRPEYHTLNIVGFSFMVTTSQVEIKSFVGLKSPTFAGLQPALVPWISSDAVASITAEQAKWMLIDTWIAFEADKHIPFLTVEAIAAIPVSILGMTISTKIPYFTAAQIKAMNPAVLLMFDCLRLSSLEDHQIMGLPKSTLEALDVRAQENRCKLEKTFVARASVAPPIRSPVSLSLPKAPTWVYAAFAFAGIAILVSIVTAIIVFAYIRHAGNPANTIISPTAQSLFGSRASSMADEDSVSTDDDRASLLMPDEPESSLSSGMPSSSSILHDEDD